MDIYAYPSYRDFLRARLESGSGTRGASRKLSSAMRCHPTLLSQVLAGGRDLSAEQGYSACEYFGMTEEETEFFLLLLQKERAGSEHLKRFVARQISQKRKQRSEFKNRLPIDTQITDAERSIFYSHWIYAAIWLEAGLTSTNTATSLAERLDIDLRRVREVLEFLVSAGLVRLEGEGYQMTSSRIHIPRESPLSTRHHVNWRLKAIHRFDAHSDRDLFFTSPLTISRKDARLVSDRLKSTIDEISGMVGRTDPQELRCLNLDWFAVSPR